MVNMNGPETVHVKKPVPKLCAMQKILCVNVWDELKVPVKKPWCAQIVQTWMHYVAPIQELWPNCTNSDRIQIIRENFGIMAHPADTFWTVHTFKRMCAPFKA
jgi:hypothetical protein